MPRSELPGDPGSSNPYEAPKAALEGQTSVRGFWTGQVVIDVILGVPLVCLGLNLLAVAVVDWSAGLFSSAPLVLGLGTLVFGLFLLSRVQKAWRRAIGVKA